MPLSPTEKLVRQVVASLAHDLTWEHEELLREESQWTDNHGVRPLIFAIMTFPHVGIVILFELLIDEHMNDEAKSVLTRVFTSETNETVPLFDIFMVVYNGIVKDIIKLKKAGVPELELEASRPWRAMQNVIARARFVGEVEAICDGVRDERTLSLARAELLELLAGPVKGFKVGSNPREIAQEFFKFPGHVDTTGMLDDEKETAKK